eukprot:Colp12_sorted_trinity150504_noHs@26240
MLSCRNFKSSLLSLTVEPNQRLYLVGFCPKRLLTYSTLSAMIRSSGHEDSLMISEDAVALRRLYQIYVQVAIRLRVLPCCELRQLDEIATLRVSGRILQRELSHLQTILNIRYQKYTSLYKDWWCAAWSTSKVDNYDDLLKDMNAFLAPPPQKICDHEIEPVEVLELGDDHETDLEVIDMQEGKANRLKKKHEERAQKPQFGHIQRHNRPASPHHHSHPRIERIVHCDVVRHKGAKAFIIKSDNTLSNMPRHNSEKNLWRKLTRKKRRDKISVDEVTNNSVIESSASQAVKDTSTSSKSPTRFLQSTLERLNIGKNNG